MIVPSAHLTDESSDVVINGENSVYRRKYFTLLQRCEHLQKENERIVHRIQEVGILLKRSRKDRKLLMTRLDHYGDSWRTAPLPLAMEEDKPEVKQTPATAAKVANSPVEKTKKCPPAKKKTRPDPLAPKRPANPFFQFCQEQRPIVTEQVVGEGHEEVSKQELTRMLANRWKTLSNENKKVYYEKYEKQKEKYAVDMQIYGKKVAAGNTSKESSQ